MKNLSGSQQSPNTFVNFVTGEKPTSLWYLRFVTLQTFIWTGNCDSSLIWSISFGITGSKQSQQLLVLIHLAYHIGLRLFLFLKIWARSSHPLLFNEVTYFHMLLQKNVFWVLLRWTAQGAHSLYSEIGIKFCSLLSVLFSLHSARAPCLRSLSCHLSDCSYILRSLAWSKRLWYQYAQYCGSSDLAFYLWSTRKNTKWILYLETGAIPIESISCTLASLIIDFKEHIKYLKKKKKLCNISKYC